MENYKTEVYYDSKSVDVFVATSLLCRAYEKTSETPANWTCISSKFEYDGVFNILYKETSSGTICAVDYSTTSPYIYDECKAKNPLNEEAVIDFEKDYMFNRVCIPPYRHDLIKYASRGTVLFEVPWSDHRKCKSLSKEYDYINRIFFGIKKNKEGIYDVNVMYNWENRRINYE